jgi:hypothetical protein
VPNSLSYVSGSIPSLNALYELNVKVRYDEKALGMSACIGRPPRPPISG